MKHPMTKESAAALKEALNGYNSSTEVVIDYDNMMELVDSVIYYSDYIDKLELSLLSILRED